MKARCPCRGAPGLSHAPVPLSWRFSGPNGVRPVLVDPPGPRSPRTAHSAFYGVEREPGPGRMGHPVGLVAVEDVPPSVISVITTECRGTFVSRIATSRNGYARRVRGMPVRPKHRGLRPHPTLCQKGGGRPPVLGCQRSAHATPGRNTPRCHRPRHAQPQSAPDARRTLSTQPEPCIRSQPLPRSRRAVAAPAENT